MTQETNDVVTQELIERLWRESQSLFPANQRDGHAYHSTATALDKAADALQSQSAHIAEQDATIKLQALRLMELSSEIVELRSSLTKDSTSGGSDAAR